MQHLWAQQARGSTRHLKQRFRTGSRKTAMHLTLTLLCLLLAPASSDVTSVTEFQTHILGGNTIIIQLPPKLVTLLLPGRMKTPSTSCFLTLPSSRSNSYLSMCIWMKKPKSTGSVTTREIGWFELLPLDCDRIMGISINIRWGRDSPKNIYDNQQDILKEEKQKV